MKKVDGVDGVRVSLKEGLTILELKPGNTVTLSRLRTIIKNNGFVSKDATIVARGRTSTVGGHRRFEVEGTGEALAPAADPERAADAWKLVVKN